MKALNWIAWISAGIGVVLMLLGGISGLIAKNILPGVTHIVNYFLIADSFFLITIALFVFIYRCQCKKE
jgi:hypothetical protein